MSKNTSLLPKLLAGQQRDIKKLLKEINELPEYQIPTAAQYYASEFNPELNQYTDLQKPLDELVQNADKGRVIIDPTDPNYLLYIPKQEASIREVMFFNQLIRTVIQQRYPEMLGEY